MEEFQIERVVCTALDVRQGDCFLLINAAQSKVEFSDLLRSKK